MQRRPQRAQWYGQMFESTSSAIFVYTLDGSLVDINPAACALHGWTREEMLAKRPSEFIAPESIAVFDAFRDALSRGQEYRGQARGVRSDESQFDVEVYGVPIELDGEIFAFSSLTDITETLRLRRELEEVQRMDALGRLAGGVAHDFNNMLMIIVGSAEYGMLERDPAKIQDAFADIIDAVTRARELTAQLMAFSQNRAICHQRVDVNDLVRRCLTLIERVFPKNIAFDTFFESGPLPVQGDPSPLEQMVVNLLLNARDALAGSAGHIRLGTKRRVIEDVTIADLPAGAYVELTIEDDGAGMSRATMARAFEPFFTTKGVGGTGLGLASAYGIVRQHGGCIALASEEGRGTTFRVYLPLDDAIAPTDVPEEPEYDPLEETQVAPFTDIDPLDASMHDLPMHHAGPC